MPIPRLVLVLGTASYARWLSNEQLRWISIKQFCIKLKEGKKICAYCPNRGGNKWNVCGSSDLPDERIESVGNLKIRCISCGNRRGNIYQLLGLITVTWNGQVSQYSTIDILDHISKLLASGSIKD